MENKKLTTRTKVVKNFLYKLLQEHFIRKDELKNEDIYLENNDWARFNSVYVYTSSNLNKIKKLLQNGVFEIDINDVSKEFSYDFLTDEDKLNILFIIDQETDKQINNLEA